MLKTFKKYINKKSKAKDIPCTYEQVNYNPKFQLKYQDNIIGFLNYENSIWHFTYSDWFKNTAAPKLPTPIAN